MKLKCLIFGHYWFFRPYYVEDEPYELIYIQSNPYRCKDCGKRIDAAGKTKKRRQ